MSTEVVYSTAELNLAIDRIRADFGDVVSVAAKKKTLLKFGRNPNVGSSATGYTIWYTGQDQAHETYVAANTNSIDSISSSDSDTVDVTVEGHTESGGNKTFVIQTVTLTGQTRAPLTTPLNRVTRVYNSSSTNLAGSVFVYENTGLTSGKPTDTTKIHLTIPAGKNQSQKASTSISSTDYWILTSFRGSMLEKTASFADVELQIRRPNNVFRAVEDVTCSASHNGMYNFQPYVVVPKNSDVRLVAISDSTSRDVSGSIQGYLAQIIA